MEEEDYRLILVENTRVGLIGLNESFGELKRERGMMEAELKTILGESVGRLMIKRGLEEERG